MLSQVNFFMPLIIIKKFAKTGLTHYDLGNVKK